MRSALLFLPFVVVAHAAADESADLRARFLAEYEPAAKRATERLSKNWRGVVRSKELKEDGKLDFEVVCEFLANDRCIRVKQTTTVARENVLSIEWHLLRPDGMYQIKPGKRPDEYVLKRSQLGNITILEAGFPFKDLILPLTMRGRPLVDYVQQDGLRVVRFSDAVIDGVNLKQLKVEWKRTTTSGAATFNFHTGEEWLLHSYLLEPGAGRRPTLFRFRYRTLGKETVLQRQEVYRIGPGGGESLWGASEYEFERANPPDSEFTLSQFGLPEALSFVPRKKSVPLYVWILATAAGCAALAFGLRYLARRRAVPSTPPPAPSTNE
jgi:hypothetical protein